MNYKRSYAPFINRNNKVQNDSADHNIRKLIIQRLYAMPSLYNLNKQRYAVILMMHTINLKKQSTHLHNCSTHMERYGSTPISSKRKTHNHNASHKTNRMKYNSKINISMAISDNIFALLAIMDIILRHKKKDSAYPVQSPKISIPPIAVRYPCHNQP